MRSLRELVVGPLHDLGGGVWSALPEPERPALYDRIAWAYDAFIANGVYNRLVWGVPPRDHQSFAEEALDGVQGPFLDAGCGSLVFTHRAYATTPTPTVLLDRSRGMLRRAADRLPPDHPHLLLQGDISDLPFASDTFERVATYGVLHVIEDRGPALAELRRVLRPAGRLYAMALVRSGRWLGDGWLAALRVRGEIAEPATAGDYEAELAAAGFDVTTRAIGGVAFFVAQR